MTARHTLPIPAEPAGSVSSVDLFLLDMDGTIYLGDRLFACTRPFLEAVRFRG